MSNVDESGDKFLDFEAFFGLIDGSKMDGLNSWQRKAFRHFVKQTADNILPYHYQYQNQVRVKTLSLPEPILRLVSLLLQHQCCSMYLG
jgi:hypothetical protein